jgi:hypothetical protein
VAAAVQKRKDAIGSAQTYKKDMLAKLSEKRKNDNKTELSDRDAKLQVCKLLPVSSTTTPVSTSTGQ